MQTGPKAGATLARGWIDALRTPAAGITLLAALATVAALWAAAAFVVPVTMAVLLAVLLRPLCLKLQRWVRLRAVAALLVLAAAALLVTSLGMLVATQISASAEHLPDALRNAARDVADMGRIDRGATLARTRKALDELDRSVAKATGTAVSTPAARAKSSPDPSLVQAAIDWVSGAVLVAGKATLGVLLQAGVIFMLAFFLLCSGDRLSRRLSHWCDGKPLARGRVSPLVGETAREMRRFAAVTALTNAFIALAVAAGFAAFGVPNPVVWGLAAGALHFVPYAGLALTMLLAAVEVYAAQASITMALLAVAYVACVGVVVGTALAVWLQGRASRVDSALTFGGTVFFSVLWGGWGLVLGPLLVVALHVLARHAALLSAQAPIPEVAGPELAAAQVPGVDLAA